MFFWNWWSLLHQHGFSICYSGRVSCVIPMMFQDFLQDSRIFNDFHLCSPITSALSSKLICFKWFSWMFMDSEPQRRLNHENCMDMPYCHTFASEFKNFHRNWRIFIISHPYRAWQEAKSQKKTKKNKKTRKSMIFHVFTFSFNENMKKWKIRIFCFFIFS